MRDILHYCPICANVVWGIGEKALLQIYEMKCCYCNNQIISTGKEAIDLAEYRKEHHVIPDDAVREIYVYNNPLFDETKSEQRIAMETMHQAEMDQIHRDLEVYNGNNTTPKCPTCSSTAVSSIGFGKRTVSVGMLGLFSKKINKSFKCNSCGYTW